MRDSPRAALTAALAVAIARFQRDVRQLARSLETPAARAREPASPRDELVTVLRGNVAAVARALGKAPIQVRRWCWRYALDLAEFRGPELQREQLREQQRCELAAMLREHGGNLSAVGRALGRAPVQIRRWCQLFSLDVTAFRAEAPHTAKTPRATLLRRASLWPVQSRPAQSQTRAPRRDRFAALLREHRGSVSAVARALGKDRKQIQRWCRVLGVDAAEFRG